MKTETIVKNVAPDTTFSGVRLSNAQLVLYFVSPDFPQIDAYVGLLRRAYPAARLVGCTTGGEIEGGRALEGAAVSAAVFFEKSRIRTAQRAIQGPRESYSVGSALGQKLAAPDLRYVFLLSDGLNVNGSELTRGVVESVAETVIVGGGLAGDGPRFEETAVGLDEPPQSGQVVAVGFYGDDLTVSYGTMGGWTKFGASRLITRASGNVLHELDGLPALDLYKSYLGDDAQRLPGSGLLHPLCIRAGADDPHEIVRTIVGINENTKSMTFAGEIPEGYIAQFMHGTPESLVNGARDAAYAAAEKSPNVQGAGALAILVSCIGRNLLMGPDVSDEIKAVRQVLPKAGMIGFYSYGEISHHAISGKCALHNQTMSLTLLGEK